MGTATLYQLWEYSGHSGVLTNPLVENESNGALELGQEEGDEEEAASPMTSSEAQAEESSLGATGMAVGACIICLDSDPPPIQSGCACRSDCGLAHVGCLVEKAVAQQPHRGNAVWWECQTCRQGFTGAMRTGLAEAWWSRVCHEAEESIARLNAANNLAGARDCDGQYAEAERIRREVLDVERRVFGEEHPRTLASTGLLAQLLSNLPPDQRKYAEAERIGREVLGVSRRVLGEEHQITLISASSLALSLFYQRKFAEAERIGREVLDVQRRVFGEEHKSTLTDATNLALSIALQGKHAEAEAMLQAVHQAQQRLLGSAHPCTVATVECLECVRADSEKFLEHRKALARIKWRLVAYLLARLGFTL